ncbi:MAG: deoxyribose-phosphate aldolase [Erysipelotrichaceae bacterium]
MKINKLIDHTLLKPDATKEQIKKLCLEAIEHDFASVCVNPTHIAYCKDLLQGSDVKVCTVIGFPLGATFPQVKAYETKLALENGAQELDMVINIGALKDNNYDLVVEDIKAVVNAADGHCVKVIIETCLLTDDEKRLATQACLDAKATFVKTSTGFSTSGATFEDVAILKSVAKDNMLIKAAGGVRSYEDVLKMVENGANRIGTSSGVKLVTK